MARLIRKKSSKKPVLLPIVTEADAGLDPRLPVSELTRKWLEGVDARSERVRNLVTLYAGFCEDLGGIDDLSTGQREIARRASVLGLILRDIESDIVRERALSEDTFERFIIASRTQANLLRVLGLDRVKKDVTPPEDVDADLRQHLKKRGKGKERVIAGDYEEE